MEQALKVEIALVPVGRGDRDAHWQDECQRLVASLRSDLREYGADVRPSEIVSTETGTRGLAELSYSTFSLLAQSDALLAALPLAWDVLKKWLEPRAGEVGSATIRVDGSEYTITNLSKEEWLSLLQQRGVLGKRDG